MTVEAVIFDVGGVVIESPLQAIARYERDHGIAPNAINRAVAGGGEAGAWARLERGELTLQTFYAPFETECRACGIEVSGARRVVFLDDIGRNLKPARAVHWGPRPARRGRPP